MAIFKRFAVFAGSVTAALAAAAGLTAALAGGEPVNWGMGFQPPASPTMERIQQFNDSYLLPIITLIVVFVLGLLLVTMWRFSEKRNPTPSKTTHNTLIEVLWTVIPVVILVIIAIPSFKLLYFADHIEDADMTIKAIGRQWYWSYEYPDHGGFIFDSNMVPEDELEEGQPRLLAADAALVLPVDTRIRFLITASDVLHAFAMPSMGLKLDAVPGRINETWVEILEEGTYYGQCSEICGTGHSYMPIMIKAVSKQDFATWVEQAKQDYAGLDAEPAPQTGASVSLAQAAQDSGQDSGKGD